MYIFLLIFSRFPLAYKNERKLVLIDHAMQIELVQLILIWYDLYCDMHYYTVKDSYLIIQCTGNVRHNEDGETLFIEWIMMRDD